MLLSLYDLLYATADLGAGFCLPHYCHVWYVLHFPLHGCNPAETIDASCRDSEIKWVQYLSLHFNILRHFKFLFADSFLNGKFHFFVEPQDWTAMKERDPEAEPLNV